MNFTKKYTHCNVMMSKCPSRKVLQHLTNRWGGLIIVTLLSGTHRFSAIRNQIEGISERMLSQNLQLLEADGILIRRSMNTVPPHVEYSLTELGKNVAVKMKELIAIVEDSQTILLNK